MNTPRTRLTHVTILFAIVLLLAAIPFAPFAGFFLHVWWNDHTESSNTPQPTESLRPRYDHGARSKNAVIAPAKITPAPTAVQMIDTGKTMPDSSPRAIREAAMDKWRDQHSDLWWQMDPGMRTCVRVRYITPEPNWGTVGVIYTVERAIEECLDYYDIKTEIDYE